MFKDWVSDENLAQMERWTRHGLSNEQIAKNIGICEQTFYNYKSGTVYGGRKVFLGFPADEKPERFFSETASAGHDKYHAKHAKEMGITVKQWGREAANILNSQKHELFLDWYNRDEKKFYRYEKATGRLAIGTKSGLISTFFILQKKHRKIYLPKEYLEIL